MTSGECSELRWLAFRYVCDELTAAEADAFERRLDDDQSAREAVAEAVALTTAVAASPPDALSLRPRRRAWVGLAAAAACVLAAVGLRQLGPATRAPGLAGGKTAPAVVLVWSGLRDESDAVAARDGLIAWLDAPSDAPLVAALDTPEAADGAPDWLFEAVALPIVARPTQEN